MGHEGFSHSALAAQLSRDGFREIGRFHIDENVFHLDIQDHIASAWDLALYAWVSTLDDGRVLRIGKAEGPLQIRLKAYKRSLNTAMSGRLEPNQYYQGDTQPWEAVGWKRWAGAKGAGLIFARQIARAESQLASAQRLAQLAKQLIVEYDPPLCGVSKAGRALKKAWEAEFGKTTAMRKRAEPAA